MAPSPEGDGADSRGHGADSYEHGADSCGMGHRAVGMGREREDWAGRQMGVVIDVVRRRLSDVIKEIKRKPWVGLIIIWDEEKVMVL